MRPYILGLASPNDLPPLDLTVHGSAGHRLWSMVHEACGISAERWLEATQRVNLLESGPLPKDFRARAAARGAYLAPLIRERTVIMLGSAVADALSHTAQPFVWDRTWVWIPHPSAKNLWYDNPVHCAATGILLADVLHDAGVFA